MQPQQRLVLFLGPIMGLVIFSACARYPIPTAVPVTQPTAAAAVIESTEPARPSNPGGPGSAINLTGDPQRGAQVFANCVPCHGNQGKGGVVNPGSADGTVPSLNPIDPTIANTDHKIFVYNVDLFIEHGSTPDGTNPALKMPAWGDSKALSPQQIADVIAYVTSLNHSTVASK